MEVQITVEYLLRNFQHAREISK